MQPSASNKWFLVWSDETKGILSPAFFGNVIQDSVGTERLASVAFINPPRKMNLDHKEEVPYIGLPETSDKRVNRILKRPYQSVKGRQIVHEGDILFARIEPSIFNKKYIYADNLGDEGYAFTSTEFIVIRAKEINAKYLFYTLFTDYVYDQFAGKTTGSTGRRRLDRSTLNDVRIPILSSSDQAKVVEKLESIGFFEGETENHLPDQINEVLVKGLNIVKTERAHDNKWFSIKNDELDSRLDVEFYLEETYSSALPFLELQKIIKLGAPSWNTRDDFTYDFPYLDIGSIDIKKGIFRNVKNIKVDEAPSRARQLVTKGDLLISTTRPGRGAIAFCPLEKAVASTGFAVVKPENSTINMDYLYYVLRSKLVLNQMEKRSSGGNYPAITTAELNKIKIPVPELDVQMKIVKELTDMQLHQDEMLAQSQAKRQAVIAEIEALIAS